MKLLPSYANPKRVRHALACCMLLVLPACGIPNLRQPDPGPNLPAEYPTSFPGANSSENSAQLRPEEFFTDPKLTCLIDQALASNQELKILNEEIQIARNEILARRGAYLPFVGIGGSMGLDKPSRFTPMGAAERELEYLPGKHFPDPLPNFLGSLNLLWRVDIWREFRNARDAAAQRYLGAIDRRNYTVTRVVAEIAENYYGLVARDKRLDNLNQTIELQEQSLKIAIARKEAGRGTELGVQRFEAEVRKNQSEKLIINQEIVEVENRINFLAARYPQPVERMTGDFIDLNLHALSVGVPAQLLQFRPDIRQAERELEASGLDILVARAHFFPRLDITGGIGYQAFSPKYLFWTPDALIGSVSGDLVAPLINKRAIQAEYMSANARQLEALYNYQRVILNAFTEVYNRVSKVQNYTKSIEIKKQQLNALVASVDVAGKLFQAARTEYIDVLFAQRDRMDALMVLIQTKQEQLSAIINTYQALGGGWPMNCPNATAEGPPLPPPPAAGRDKLPEPPAPRPDEALPAPRPAPAPPDKDHRKSGS